ncbi:hypothetical protein A1351_22030 [Methylosinus sp. R-45379]|nr:hypothetical protein A1351_22030 [Methylosinus sp. R-45379]
MDSVGRERVCEYLRRVHPQKTAEAIEARTRGAVTAARARKWFGARGSAPDFIALLHLIRAYGAEFLVFVIGDAPESLLEAAMAEQRARILEQRRALEAELESLSSR